MTQRHLSGILAAGALVLVAVTACGNQNPRTAPRPSATPTATAITSSPSTTAAANATALVHRYFAVIDEISQQPSGSLDPLTTVAVSGELTAEQRFLAAEHQRGEKQVGATHLDTVTVQTVNLDNSDPSAGKVPTVTIDVCWDVSKVDVVDRSGRSIVSPARPNTGWTRYVVANYQYATNADNGWRVASAQDLGRRSCATS